MGRIGTVIALVLVVYSCYFPGSHTEITAAQEAVITTALSGFDTAGIQSVIQYIDNRYGVWGARYATNSNIINYQNYLTGLFTSYGYTDITLQQVQCNDPGYTSAPGPLYMNNIIVVKDGAGPPVVVIAHWDSVPNCPAIDDNFSGCAGVLEIARLAYSLNFENRLVFILFGFEEESLLGSSLYADTMSERPKSVINLEMIGFTSPKENPYPGTDLLMGFPTTGDFVGVFATDFSETLGLNFIYAVDTFVPDLKYYFMITDQNFGNNPLLSLLMRSDHTSFWEKKVPALLVTDTAELRDGAVYHQTSDNYLSFDPVFHERITRAAFAALCIEAGIQP
ncbi:MAG: M28 family peptidase [Spirochaetales bacterium]|nr:M28 family peptidase [Spirochaetales bacterium]